MVVTVGGITIVSIGELGLALFIYLFNLFN